MALSFTCSCGEDVTAATEAELVEAAALHVAEAHPVVGLAPPAADVLAMAREAPDPLPARAPRLRS